MSINMTTGTCRGTDPPGAAVTAAEDGGGMGGS